MLLTAIELQGGQANIEGKSVTSHLTKNADCSSINSLLILYRNNFQLFLFRSSHGNDNKEGLKFIMKLSRD